MRKHASDMSGAFGHLPQRTMCGRNPLIAEVDDGQPDCKACLVAIRSRCQEHGVKRCKRCSR